MVGMGRGLLVAVLVLVCAGPAEAVSLVTDDGQVAQPYQRWADRSFMPTAPGPIVVRSPAHCDGESACYHAGVRDIQVASPSALTRYEFLHELGHDFDSEMGTDLMRGSFMWLIGTSPWRNGNFHNLSAGPASPNEQFADGYALCAILRPGEYLPSGTDEYEPGPRLHRRVCALIRRTAGWSMTPSAALGSAG